MAWTVSSTTLRGMGQSLLYSCAATSLSHLIACFYFMIGLDFRWHISFNYSTEYCMSLILARTDLHWLSSQQQKISSGGGGGFSSIDKILLNSLTTSKMPNSLSTTHCKSCWRGCEKCPSRLFEQLMRHFEAHTKSVIILKGIQSWIILIILGCASYNPILFKIGHLFVQ